MAKKQSLTEREKCFPEVPKGRFERQSAMVERICEDLESPNPSARAAAVRRLCPCQTKWVVPVKQLVVEMSADPHPVVRQAAAHVLYGDSKWGNSREDRRHKITYRSHRPRTRGTTKYGLGITKRAIPGLVDLFAVRWMRKRRRPVEAVEVRP